MVPKVLVGAWGFEAGDRGGSGFEDLVQKSRNGLLRARIIGVMTGYPDGTVARRAQRLEVPIYLIPVNGTASEYKTAYYTLLQKLKEEEEHYPDYTVFCGWPKTIPIYDCFNKTRTLSVYRGSLLDGERISYYDAPELDIERYLRAISGELQATITIQYVYGPNVDDGPAIVTFSEVVRFGPDIQPIKVPGKKSEKIEGPPIKRMYAIQRQTLQCVQKYYLYQVLNHVFDGLVTWSGHENDPVIKPSYYATYCVPSRPARKWAFSRFEQPNEDEMFNAPKGRHHIIT